MALDGGQQLASHHWGLYIQGKNPQCQMYKRLGEPQNQSGLFGDKKNIFLLPEIQARFHSRQTNKLITLYWQYNSGSTVGNTGGTVTVFTIWNWWELLKTVNRIDGNLVNNVNEYLVKWNLQCYCFNQTINHMAGKARNICS